MSSSSDRPNFAQPDPVPSPVFAGRFQIQAVIGRGNQGVVHRAYDRQERQTVALKLYDSIASARQVERFLAAERSKILRYDTYVLHYLAVGFEDTTPYVAMDLADGKRLTERLSAGPPFLLKEAVVMMGALAYTVGKLHEEGLWHRNIKPDNIFLSKYGKDHPKLSDIWVDLRRGARPVYRSEILDASRGYIAPEQWKGDGDARADVYSLAAVLYHCVAGCPADGQALAKVRPDAPSALCDLLAASLSPNPADRPKDALALSFALNRLEKTLGLEGESPPYPISGVGAARRALPRPRVVIDPFTDRVFQDELYGLVRPRCQVDNAISYLHMVTHAVHHFEREKLSGCALCGVGWLGAEIVEITPKGFSRLAEGGGARATPPYLCGGCLRTEHGVAHGLLVETLASLAGRDDEPMRPGGPMRRELREGLSRLMADYRPHVEKAVPCGRCGSVGSTLRGAEIDLCISCVVEARETSNRWHKARWDERQERLRAAYARLFVRAEARLMRQGRGRGLTAEEQVELPPSTVGQGWFYTDIEFLIRDPNPTQARIDEVATKLANSLEEHVLNALREWLDNPQAAKSVQGESGLPGYTKRYLDRFHPSPTVDERIQFILVLLSELLYAGHRFTHKTDEYEWGDATGYFETIHDLAGPR